MKAVRYLLTWSLLELFDPPVEPFMFWRELELVLEDAELLSEKPEKYENKNENLINIYSNCACFYYFLILLIFENVSWEI